MIGPLPMTLNFYTSGPIFLLWYPFSHTVTEIAMFGSKPRTDRFNFHKVTIFYARVCGQGHMAVSVTYLKGTGV